MEEKKALTWEGKIKKLETIIKTNNKELNDKIDNLAKQMVNRRN